MHKHLRTRAGNYRRHSRIRNASTPMQASIAARAPQPGCNTCTYQDTTHASPPHPVLPRHQAKLVQHGTHLGRNRNPHSAPTTEIEVSVQPLGTRNRVQTPQRPSRYDPTDKIPSRVEDVQNLNVKTWHGQPSSTNTLDRHHLRVECITSCTAMA